MSYAHRPSAATARDGYVGLNFNPRMPGRPGPTGLDHFGIEVEDIEESFAMAEEKYPTVEWVKRSGPGPMPRSASMIPMVRWSTSIRRT